MGFKAYIGCCCCCSKRSKPYVESCATFFIVFCAIKLLALIPTTIFSSGDSTLLAVYLILDLINIGVMIIGIIMCNQRKKPNWNFIKMVGIITVVLFIIEMILEIVAFVIYVQFISGVKEEVEDSHGEEAGAITHFFVTLALIPILLYLGLFIAFSIWQIHAAGWLIKCGSYNQMKQERGEEESMSSAKSSDSSDSEKAKKKRKKKKRKQEQNNPYQGGTNTHHQPPPQQLQYANPPTQMQNQPMPPQNQYPPNPPPPYQGQPIPMNQNPYAPSNPNQNLAYAQPGPNPNMNPLPPNTQNYQPPKDTGNIGF